MRSQRASKDPTPTAKLTSLSDTVRTEGFGWLIRRIRYRTPISPWGRFVHHQLRRLIGLLLTIPRAALRQNGDTETMNPDSLYAFFDLQVAPITYDVGWFAAGADRMRREQNLARIHFVIVPGNKDGFREERAAYETVVDTSARLWRLYNVVLPILTLVPAYSGLSLLPHRDAVRSLRAMAGHRVYPSDYEPSLPVAHLPVELLQNAPRQDEEIGILRSPLQAMRYMERWMAPRLSGRKLITITLRNYAYMPARNSDTDAWIAFARRLDSTKYLPLFVLDTERTLDPLPDIFSDFEVLREASWNVWLRMALYESSYVNLGVNNGPLFACALNARTRLLIFKIITASVPQTTEEMMSKLGFKIGCQLPFTTPFQRLIWEDDTLETIEREFVKLVHRIEELEKT